MQARAAAHLDVLRRQAAAASIGRRVAARWVAHAGLLGVAATLGGLLQGHPPHGAAAWSAAHATAIATVCVAPLCLLERVLPSTRVGAALSAALGAVLFGGALLLAGAALELHHGASAALLAAQDAVSSLAESPRPWLLAGGPGVALGLGSAWRRRPGPLTERWALGGVLLSGIAAVLFGGSALGFESEGLARVLLGLLVLPMAQLACFISLCADGLSMGLPHPNVPDEGPRPTLPLIDRILGAGHLLPAIDAVALTAGTAAGVRDVGPLGGVGLGVLFWFLVKVAFAGMANTWPLRLEGAGEVERAVAIRRFQRHGRPGDDPIRAHAGAGLLGLLIRSGRLDEAEAELPGLLSLLHRLRARDVYGLAACWSAAGRPEVARALLERWDRPIPKGLQAAWAELAAQVRTRPGPSVE